MMWGIDRTAQSSVPTRKPPHSLPWMNTTFGKPDFQQKFSVIPDIAKVRNEIEDMAQDIPHADKVQKGAMVTYVPNSEFKYSGIGCTENVAEPIQLENNRSITESLQCEANDLYIGDVRSALTQCYKEVKQAKPPFRAAEVDRKTPVDNKIFTISGTRKDLSLYGNKSVLPGVGKNNGNDETSNIGMIKRGQSSFALSPFGPGVSNPYSLGHDNLSNISSVNSSVMEANSGSKRNMISANIKDPGIKNDVTGSNDLFRRTAYICSKTDSGKDLSLHGGTKNAMSGICKETTNKKESGGITGHSAYLSGTFLTGQRNDMSLYGGNKSVIPGISKVTANKEESDDIVGQPVILGDTLTGPRNDISLYGGAKNIIPGIGKVTAQKEEPENGMIKRVQSSHALSPFGSVDVSNVYRQHQDNQSKHQQEKMSVHKENGYLKQNIDSCGSGSNPRAKRPSNNGHDISKDGEPKGHKICQDRTFIIQNGMDLSPYGRSSVLPGISKSKLIEDEGVSPCGMVKMVHSSYELSALTVGTEGVGTNKVPDLKTKNNHTQNIHSVSETDKPLKDPGIGLEYREIPNNQAITDVQDLHPAVNTQGHIEIVQSKVAALMESNSEKSLKSGSNSQSGIHTNNTDRQINEFKNEEVTHRSISDFVQEVAVEYSIVSSTSVRREKYRKSEESSDSIKSFSYETTGSENTAPEENLRLSVDMNKVEISRTDGATDQKEIVPEENRELATENYKNEKSDTKRSNSCIRSFLERKEETAKGENDTKNIENDTTKYVPSSDKTESRSNSITTSVRREIYRPSEESSESCQHFSYETTESVKPEVAAGKENDKTKSVPSSDKSESRSNSITTSVRREIYRPSEESTESCQQLSYETTESVKREVATGEENDRTKSVPSRDKTESRSNSITTSIRREIYRPTEEATESCQQLSYETTESVKREVAAGEEKDRKKSVPSSDKTELRSNSITTSVRREIYRPSEESTESCQQFSYETTESVKREVATGEENDRTKSVPSRDKTESRSNSITTSVRREIYRPTEATESCQQLSYETTESVKPEVAAGEENDRTKSVPSSDKTESRSNSITTSVRREIYRPSEESTESCQQLSYETTESVKREVAAGEENFMPGYSNEGSSLTKEGIAKQGFIKEQDFFLTEGDERVIPEGQSELNDEKNAVEMKEEIRNEENHKNSSRIVVSEDVNSGLEDEKSLSDNSNISSSVRREDYIKSDDSTDIVKSFICETTASERQGPVGQSDMNDEKNVIKMKEETRNEENHKNSSQIDNKEVKYVMTDEKSASDINISSSVRREDYRKSDDSTDIVKSFSYETTARGRHEPVAYRANIDICTKYEVKAKSIDDLKYVDYNRDTSDRKISDYEVVDETTMPPNSNISTSVREKHLGEFGDSAESINRLSYEPTESGRCESATPREEHTSLKKEEVTTKRIVEVKGVCAKEYDDVKHSVAGKTTFDAAEKHVERKDGVTSCQSPGQTTGSDESEPVLFDDKVHMEKSNINSPYERNEKQSKSETCTESIHANSFETSDSEGHNTTPHEEKTVSGYSYEGSFLKIKDNGTQESVELHKDYSKEFDESAKSKAVKANVGDVQHVNVCRVGITCDKYREGKKRDETNEFLNTEKINVSENSDTSTSFRKEYVDVSEESPERQQSFIFERNDKSKCDRVSPEHVLLCRNEVTALKKYHMADKEMVADVKWAFRNKDHPSYKSEVEKHKDKEILTYKNFESEGSAIEEDKMLSVRSNVSSASGSSEKNRKSEDSTESMKVFSFNNTESGKKSVSTDSNVVIISRKDKKLTQADAVLKVACTKEEEDTQKIKVDKPNVVDVKNVTEWEGDEVTDNCFREASYSERVKSVPVAEKSSSEHSKTRGLSVQEKCKPKELPKSRTLGKHNSLKKEIPNNGDSSSFSDLVKPQSKFLENKRISSAADNRNVAFMKREDANIENKNYLVDKGVKSKATVKTEVTSHKKEDIVEFSTDKDSSEKENKYSDKSDSLSPKFRYEALNNKAGDTAKSGSNTKGHKEAICKMEDMKSTNHRLAQEEPSENVAFNRSKVIVTVPDAVRRMHKKKRLEREASIQSSPTSIPEVKLSHASHAPLTSTDKLKLEANSDRANTNEVIYETDEDIDNISDTILDDNVDQTGNLQGKQNKFIKNITFETKIESKINPKETKSTLKRVTFLIEPQVHEILSPVSETVTNEENEETGSTENNTTYDTDGDDDLISDSILDDNGYVDSDTTEQNRMKNDKVTVLTEEINIDIGTTNQLTHARSKVIECEKGQQHVDEANQLNEQTLLDANTSKTATKSNHEDDGPDEDSEKTNGLFTKELPKNTHSHEGALKPKSETKHDATEIGEWMQFGNTNDQVKKHLPGPSNMNTFTNLFSKTEINDFIVGNSHSNRQEVCQVQKHTARENERKHNLETKLGLNDHGYYKPLAKDELKSKKELTQEVYALQPGNSKTQIKELKEKLTKDESEDNILKPKPATKLDAIEIGNQKKIGQGAGKVKTELASSANSGEKTVKPAIEMISEKNAMGNYEENGKIFYFKDGLEKDSASDFKQRRQKHKTKPDYSEFGNYGQNDWEDGQLTNRLEKNENFDRRTWKQSHRTHDMIKAKKLLANLENDKPYDGDVGYAKPIDIAATKNNYTTKEVLKAKEELAKMVYAKPYNAELRNTKPFDMVAANYKYSTKEVMKAKEELAKFVYAKPYGSEFGKLENNNHADGTAKTSEKQNSKLDTEHNIPELNKAYDPFLEPLELKDRAHTKSHSRSDGTDNKKRKIIQNRGDEKHFIRSDSTKPSGFETKHGNAEMGNSRLETEQQSNPSETEISVGNVTRESEMLKMKIKAANDDRVIIVEHPILGKVKIVKKSTQEDLSSRSLNADFGKGIRSENGTEKLKSQSANDAKTTSIQNIEKDITSVSKGCVLTPDSPSMEKLNEKCTNNTQADNSCAKNKCVSDSFMQKKNMTESYSGVKLSQCHQNGEQEIVNLMETFLKEVNSKGGITESIATFNQERGTTPDYGNHNSFVKSTNEQEIKTNDSCTKIPLVDHTAKTSIKAISAKYDSNSYFRNDRVDTEQEIFVKSSNQRYHRSDVPAKPDSIAGGDTEEIRFAKQFQNTENFNANQIERGDDCRVVRKRVSQPDLTRCGVEETENFRRRTRTHGNLSSESKTTFIPLSTAPGKTESTTHIIESLRNNVETNEAASQIRSETISGMLTHAERETLRYGLDYAYLMKFRNENIYADLPWRVTDSKCVHDDLTTWSRWQQKKLHSYLPDELDMSFPEEESSWKSKIGTSNVIRKMDTEIVKSERLNGTRNNHLHSHMVQGPGRGPDTHVIILGENAVDKESEVKVNVITDDAMKDNGEIEREADDKEVKTMEKRSGKLRSFFTKFICICKPKVADGDL